METTFIYRHTRLGILTERPGELVDLTEGLTSLLADVALDRGFVNVQSLDRRAAIVVAEGSPAPGDAPPRRALAAFLRVSDGRLTLGGARRVFLVDKDAPSPRELAVVIVGEGRR